MQYTLRPYQKQAVDTAVAYFKSTAAGNAIEILPTGAGKSLVIANIALGVDTPMLIFQPSKEILEQNYAKLASYGIVDCGIYSASFNRKEIAKVTFCTIGSVIRHLDDLKAYRYALIDECHGVNSDAGMYRTTIKYLGLKVVGLTATPYRLTPDWEGGSIIKFLTRTRPCIFSKVIHVTQVKELCDAGFLAPLNYYDVQHQYQFDLTRVKLNSTGRDYDEDSLKAEYERCNFDNIVEDIVKRLMGKGNRRRILVFTKFVDEAAALAAKIPHAAFVSGETPKAEREKILADFKSGDIQCVANVGVLTTGFDYPELDTILLARPTRSLAMYYQMVGRAIRPYPNKVGWIVDICGTFKRFGKVQDLELRCEGRFKWAVWNAATNTQITNVHMD